MYGSAPGPDYTGSNRRAGEFVSFIHHTHVCLSSTMRTTPLFSDETRTIRSLIEFNDIKELAHWALWASQSQGVMWSHIKAIKRQDAEP